MTRTDHLYVESFFATLIVLLIAVVYYTDRRFTQARARNLTLETRIHNLQTLVRIQDAMIAAKIDVVLDEYRAAKSVPGAEGDLFNVDDFIARMQYCYTCDGMRSPSHFEDPDHRTTPAPELYDPAITSEMPGR